MGGAGRGRGNVAPISDQKTAFQKSQLPQKMDAGKIISVIKVEGAQVKGEAKLQFESALKEYSQEAEESLDREQIPLHMRDFVGDYYDSIRAATEK